ncbi:hypothetical protein T265_03650 [Opisthorchis viverrini]|uniref:Uncharacterized protein n=1 Tax=Opisthorchis viverrini TaxID=6198 RepID=A0A074ZQQ6_OPIVI|nr:hypothetical protein T265_03650 [Opisthorchis viverrini]KER29738.1 hypothetical protein T265_03650 [Opisthorchis viverrini]
MSLPLGAKRRKDTVSCLPSGRTMWAYCGLQETSSTSSTRGSYLETRSLRFKRIGPGTVSQYHTLPIPTGAAVNFHWKLQTIHQSIMRRFKRRSQSRIKRIQTQNDITKLSFIKPVRIEIRQQSSSDGGSIPVESVETRVLNLWSTQNGTKFSRHLEVKGWSPLCLRHSELGVENNAFFGKRRLGIRNTCLNQHNFCCFAHSSMGVPITQPKTRFLTVSLRNRRHQPTQGAVLRQRLSNI